MISPQMRNWIAGCVTVVWAVNFVATLIPQLSYKPDPALHAVFMGIVGGAFALSHEKKEPTNEPKKSEKDKEEEGQPS